MSCTTLSYTVDTSNFSSLMRGYRKLSSTSGVHGDWGSLSSCVGASTASSVGTGSSRGASGPSREAVSAWSVVLGGLRRQNKDRFLRYYCFIHVRGKSIRPSVNWRSLKTISNKQKPNIRKDCAESGSPQMLPLTHAATLFLWQTACHRVDRQETYSVERRSYVTLMYSVWRCPAPHHLLLPLRLHGYLGWRLCSQSGRGQPPSQSPLSPLSPDPFDPLRSGHLKTQPGSLLV